MQRYAPKSPPYVAPPGGFVPFAIGYVELPEGLRVEAVLNVAPDDLERLAIGAKVRLGATDGAVPRGELT